MLYPTTKLLSGRRNQSVEHGLITAIRLMFTLYLMTCALTAHAADDDWDCGDPFQNRSRHLVDDYRDQSPKVRFHLLLVEKTHYFDYVKMLGKPNLNTSDINLVLVNLDYTLRHFPNHHGSIYFVSQLQRKLGGTLPRKAYFQIGTWHRSVDCYVERAIAFAPDDPGIYLVYGTHLHRINDMKKALEMYKKSESLDPDSVELLYNMGLLYFDLKDYDLSKKYAARAYELGYKLPGLKNKLMKINKW